MLQTTTSILALVALLPSMTPTASGADSKPAPAFNADIRPLFQANCTECHGEAEKPKGGLDLRLQRFTLKGGKSGVVVVPGKPDQSYLIERVTSGEMPPGKK